MDCCGSLLLYQEDDVGRKFMTELLQEVGYIVNPFGQAHSVDEMLKVSADLALLDLVGPEYHGFYIADGLRIGGMRSPIIFLVKLLVPAIADELHSFSNVRGILQKPVQARELVGKLNSVLQLQHF